jgi:diaminopimelate epimerase
MKIQFTKMHGTGNDFIVIDSRKVKVPNFKKFSKEYCDRRFGVGADQVLVLSKSRKADFRMDIYNADGSSVGMCGNGLRCLAKYVRDEKLTTKNEVTVETPSGIQIARILSKNKVRVDMGAPILKGKQIPVNLSGRVINRPLRVDGKEIRGTCVSMGNPHCVIFVEDPKTYPVEKLGPQLERHHLFPQRTNVEFVRAVTPKLLEMRVWERGAGETLACGSGACAAAVAAVLNNQAERAVTVKLPGGSLEIEWSREDDHVYLTGAAETVFKGEIEI